MNGVPDVILLVVYHRGDGNGLGSCIDGKDSSEKGIAAPLTEWTQITREKPEMKK